MKKLSENAKRTKFEEERARQILCHFYPEKYLKSELNDSPDIINNNLNIGVEVTSAMKENINENISRVSSIVGKYENELTKIDLKNIKTGNVIPYKMPNNKLTAATVFWGNSFDFKKIYNKKINKLNSSHYKKFEENNLFVFAWMADSDEIDEGISFFLNIDEMKAYKFKYIYIFSGDNLYTINLNLKYYEFEKIDSKDLIKISNSSFEKIYGMTKEEHREMHK